MKGILCLLVVAVVKCEPPLPYRYSRVQFQKQELTPDNREQTTPSPRNAPYPPAGWRPQKEFELPSKQKFEPPSTSYGTPDTTYGAPFKTYSAPQTEYGAPEKSTENTAQESTIDFESLRVEGLKKEQSEKQTASTEIVSSQGAYYVLLPDSRLQRVKFMTENDLRNMAYTARLQYRDEERAPLYVYAGASQPAAYTPVSAPSSAYVQFA